MLEQTQMVGYGVVPCWMDVYVMDVYVMHG